MGGQPHGAERMGELAVVERTLPSPDRCHRNVLRRPHRSQADPAILARNVPVRCSLEPGYSLGAQVLLQRPHVEFTPTHLEDERGTGKELPVQLSRLCVGFAKEHDLPRSGAPPHEHFRGPYQDVRRQDFGCNLGTETFRKLAQKCQTQGPRGTKRRRTLLLYCDVMQARKGAMCAAVNEYRVPKLEPAALAYFNVRFHVGVLLPGCRAIAS